MHKGMHNIYKNTSSGELLDPENLHEILSKVSKGKIYMYDGEEYYAWPGDMYKGCLGCDLYDDEGCQLGITIQDMITDKVIAQHLINGDRFVKKGNPPRSI